MFQWVYRGPRSIEDFEAAFILSPPPAPNTMKMAAQKLSRRTVLTTPQELERTLKTMINAGKVTRVYVVNRAGTEPLTKLFVKTLCDHIESRGIHAVYSERPGEV